MNDQAMLKLKAKLDAANKRIADHKPLERGAAIEKIRSFAAKCGMTKEDLFPKPYEWEEDPVPEPDPNWDRTPFPDFYHPDTFHYTFLADLEEQRDAIVGKIARLEREHQNEAIERARAFITEYALTKEDIYPKAEKSKGKPR